MARLIGSAVFPQKLWCRPFWRSTTQNTVPTEASWHLCTSSGPEPGSCKVPRAQWASQGGHRHQSTFLFLPLSLSVVLSPLLCCPHKSGSLQPKSLLPSFSSSYSTLTPFHLTVEHLKCSLTWVIRWIWKKIPLRKLRFEKVLGTYWKTLEFPMETGTAGGKQISFC